MQNVFIVDDSPLVRERLAELLADVQLTRIVGEAAGVREAIRDILAAKPHVVLLDISLSNGSGFEVLKAVHSAEPEIEFYMLSNFASEPYRRYAERLGARKFFDKSNEFERVRDAVAKRAVSLAH
jgi:DNA-binding NarL/FixJ family response regulator